MMSKKTIALVLCMVLALTLGLGSTLAYLTDSDADVNVMTLGKVDILQNEQQWNDDKTALEPFENNKPLLPYVGAMGWDNTDEDDGAYRTFTMENVVDKYVSVTNKGNSDAYVRTILAAEMGEYESLDEFRYNIIGFSENFVNGSEFKFPGTWEWDDFFVAQIDGKNYMIMTATHQDVLEPGETTIPSLLQVYMNKACGNEEVEKVDGNDNGTYDIIALSQAVQAQGFDNAKDALKEGFGEVNANNIQEWFGSWEKWSPETGEIGSPGDENDTNDPPVFFTGDPEELQNLLSNATDANSGNVTIELTESFDMTGIDWTPITVDGYHGADVVTIEGNGQVIKGLNAPLFAGGFAGESGIIIKDLTIADSVMTAPTSQGSGTFICCVDSMETIILENCHAKNVTLNGKSRTGGLIGWTSGYSNQNDGPVKTYVTISDCTVEDCTINAETESAGGFIGHSGASDWTYTTISNSKVINTEINGGSDRTGIYIGTSNVGETTITGCTNEDVTGTLNSSHPLYGRTAHGSTGKLVIDGTSID